MMMRVDDDDAADGDDEATSKFPAIPNSKLPAIPKICPAGYNFQHIVVMTMMMRGDKSFLERQIYHCQGLM
jgi:hypothetical protein